MPPRDDRPRSTDEGESVLVRHRWTGLERVPIVFANHMWVRWQEDQFLLTFGQAELPFEPEISQETRENLKAEGLPIRPVVRLAISPAFMSRTIEGLTKVHRATQDTHQESREHDTTSRTTT
jgi:hypothetical protein